MANSVLIDGAAINSLPADDRGLAYGDGVFRTVRIENGRAIGWGAHLERLAHDCQALGLDMPEARLLERDRSNLFAHDATGVLKIIVTRGSGGRGYTPPASGSRRIVSAHALPGDARGTPAALALSRSLITLACQPRLAGIKHLNRLEQVLARADCEHRGQADAWMADSEGFVIATTMRNLFFVDAHGRWSTPAITRAGIIGATRQRLIAALSAAGIPVAEVDLPAAQLDTVTGALACNSVGGVAAVAEIDGRRLVDSEMTSETARRLLTQE